MAAPARVHGVTSDTVADMRLYLEIGLVPVTCTACGAEVAVKKNSAQHTSVQWTRAATASCPELASVTGLRLGCARLKDSIADAVADGTLVVPDE